MTTTSRCALVLATFTDIAALTLIVLSLASYHWVEVQVDRAVLEAMAAANPSSSLATRLLAEDVYYSRSRGLFETCYSLQDNNETAWIRNNPNVASAFLGQAMDGTWCLAEQGYSLGAHSNQASGYTADVRAHLMRTHVALFLLSALLYFLCAVVGAAASYQRRARSLRAVGTAVFIGAFVASFGMALFHGYEYLENYVIVDLYPFPGFLASNSAYADLVRNSLCAYGFSYIVGWVSVGLGTLTGILFISAAYRITEAKYEQMKGRLQDDFYNEKGSSMSNGYVYPTRRNRAYDYVEREMPVAAVPPAPIGAPTFMPAMYQSRLPPPQLVTNQVSRAPQATFLVPTMALQTPADQQLTTGSLVYGINSSSNPIMANTVPQIINPYNMLVHQPQTQQQPECGHYLVSAATAPIATTNGNNGFLFYNDVD